MNYAEKPEPMDEVVKDKGISLIFLMQDVGVTVMVDSKALMFVVGTQMDFV